jgi:hypothetical protein
LNIANDSLSQGNYSKGAQFDLCLRQGADSYIEGNSESKKKYNKIGMQNGDGSYVK